MSDPFWLSRDEVRELDRRAIEDFGVPGVVLMENAGRGAARLLGQLDPDRRPIVVMCGPGNNGGDGFVIARYLDARRWPVTVLMFADPDRLAGDAATNFRIVQRSGLRMEVLPQLADAERHPAVTDRAWWTGGWVVDALYGTGLARPLDAPFPQLFETLDRAARPVLAVDIPSGIDCDTGEPVGPALRAEHTATFVARKKGFRNPKSRRWTGEVHVIEIGAPRLLVDEFRQRRTG